MRRVGRALMFAAVLALPSAGSCVPWQGASTFVVDGDTLMVGSARVRLWGVDAVEGQQTCRNGEGLSYACGEQARSALRDLIGGKPVACEGVARDEYGRTVARCWAGDQDLAGAMVRQGWAVDYTTYSHGAYAAQEAAARQARLGVWQGTFERPADWRARKRQAHPEAPPRSDPAVGQPAGGCDLKGNINARGERIYHAPGQEDYAKTRINPARGERWFCSAAQAQAAGWRPARR